LRRDMRERPTNAKVARILILSLVLLAFALSVYQLDVKSIWFDESHSLNRASIDLLSIASGKEVWGDRVSCPLSNTPCGPTWGTR
jgi:hypothetical protein